LASTRDQQRSKRAAAALRAADAKRNAADAESLPFWRAVWDQLGPIAVAVLIALAIRAVIIESYYVPSGSMLSTLFVGDHVFVSKFAFGAHIPFTGLTMPAVRDPKRGEIAVFALGRGPDGQPCPLDRCPESPDEGFVKRIVGLPGETVEYKDGKVILNGKPMEQRALEETFTDESGVKARVLEEDLGECRHRVLDIPGRSMAMEKITVPPDHYFMMGDNRDNSNDSRFWGTVPRANFKGPVLINYWSWNNKHDWLGMLVPWNWFNNEVRWNRIGMTFACESVPAPAAAEPTATPAAAEPHPGAR
jgi:signal peptidase I